MLIRAALVKGICAHPLFRTRNTTLKALLSWAEVHAALQRAFHVLDEAFIVPEHYAAVSATPRFDQRAWNFGESATDFLGALIDLGHIELKEHVEVFQTFSRRVVERRNDANVLNVEVVAEVSNKFINTARSPVDVEDLKLLMGGDTHACTALQTKATRRAVALTAADLEVQASMRGFTLVPAAGSHDVDDTLALYGQDRGGGSFKMVSGPADLGAWARAGLCTEAEAQAPSWNPKREDGMWGVDCDGCKRLGFTEEYTFNQYRQKFGAPPYGANAKRPAPNTVITHWRQSCFVRWQDARKYVEQHKLPESALATMTEGEFKAMLAREKAAAARN